MLRPICLSLFPLLLAGADLPGFRVYHAGDLQGYAKKLAPKIDAQKISGQSLDRFSNHRTSVSHREGPGIGEVHTRVTDVFVVQTGAAELIVGGELVSPKTTEAGEVRGASIKGGEKVALKPGDVVHIPAKMPHQLIVDPGKEFTYFVLKIDTP